MWIHLGTGQNKRRLQFPKTCNETSWHDVGWCCWYESRTSNVQKWRAKVAAFTPGGHFVFFDQILNLKKGYKLYKWPIELCANLVSHWDVQRFLIDQHDQHLPDVPGTSHGIRVTESNQHPSSWSIPGPFVPVHATTNEKLPIMAIDRIPSILEFLLISIGLW